MGILLKTLPLLFALKAFAASTPVYLEPNNPAPTGHFNLSELKERASAYDQFEWLWVKDSFGHNGWVLKSSVLLSLDFSRRGIIAKGESIYPKPQSFNLPQKTLGQSQVVSLLGRKRDWFKILYKEKDQNLIGWVRSRYIRPYSKDPGYFFITRETPLKKRPQNKTRVLKNLTPGTQITPLKLYKSWAYVKAGNKKGYIPLTNLRSRIDIAMKVKTPKGYYKPHPSLINQKIVEIFADPLWVGTGAFSLDLKSKPDAGSNTVVTIKPWQDLHIQGYSIKRWGKSHIPKWGNLWWPEQTIESNIEIIESFEPRTQALKKSSVYQIERSPVVPGLRFASTVEGVFRSFDGKLWHPLPDFKHGYPLQIAKNGIVFVGDKVSFDHGESFRDYIRWDKVFSSIPGGRSLGHGPVQIINVEPDNKNYHDVTLSLKVGANKILQINTPNLGKSWTLR